MVQKRHTFLSVMLIFFLQCRVASGYERSQLTTTFCHLQLLATFVFFSFFLLSSYYQFRIHLHNLVRQTARHPPMTLLPSICPVSLEFSKLIFFRFRICLVFVSIFLKSSYLSPSSFDGILSIFLQIYVASNFLFIFEKIVLYSLLYTRTDITLLLFLKKFSIFPRSLLSFRKAFFTIQCHVFHPLLNTPLSISTSVLA